MRWPLCRSTAPPRKRDSVSATNFQSPTCQHNGQRATTIQNGTEREQKEPVRKSTQTGVKTCTHNTQGLPTKQPSSPTSSGES